MEIKKGHYYVIKKKYRKIQNDVMGKYVKANEDMEEIVSKWGYPFIEVRWLDLEKKEYLHEKCFLREANKEIDKKRLMVLVV